MDNYPQTYPSLTETASYRAFQLLWETAWDTVPLTLAFPFMLDGKTALTTEELVDASLGAAKHKYRLDEPGEPFLI